MMRVRSSLSLGTTILLFNHHNPSSSNAYVLVNTGSLHSGKLAYACFKASDIEGNGFLRLLQVYSSPSAGRLCTSVPWSLGASGKGMRDDVLLASLPCSSSTCSSVQPCDALCLCVMVTSDTCTLLLLVLASHCATGLACACSSPPEGKVPLRAA